MTSLIAIRNVWLPGFLITACSLNLASSFPAERKIVCQTSSGYEISQVYWLLEPDQFNEGSLRELFEPYSKMDLLGEWYIVATSDRDFWEAAAHPQFHLGSLHESFAAPLVTEEWVAYFFRISNNSFFQYGRPGGEIKWVVMRGENEFNRGFDGTELQLVGQNFTGPGDETDCRYWRRSLAFISPRVQEDDLPNVARYYSRLAAVNGMFDVSIYDSQELAVAYEDTRFPVLEDMPIYRRKLAGELLDQEIPFKHTYHFNRISPTQGEWIRYDKYGPGPPAWSQKIRLDQTTESPSIP